MRRATIAALVATACLAGCGDDETTTSASTTATESTSTTSTESTVTESTGVTTTTSTEQGGATTAEDAARIVLTIDGTAKQACETSVTTGFVAVSYGSKKNCVAAHDAGALAQSLEVESSKQTAAGVHLVVIPDGGPYDGAKVEVEVVEGPDGFRVDSLQAHVPAGP